MAADALDKAPSRTRSFGKKGKGDGLLHFPMDVASDHNGDIYVADRENHLLQVCLMAMRRASAHAHAHACLHTRICHPVDVSRAGVWGRWLILAVSWRIWA